jgi:hypothetical protein
LRAAANSRVVALLMPGLATREISGMIGRRYTLDLIDPNFCGGPAPATLDPRRQPDLYWKEMEQLKAASVCIRFCRNRWAHWVRAIELVKVVASSGGIAAWVVWKDYPLLWSGIIALAQLLDAIKNVFPFAKEHKAASDLTVALELLFIDAQYEWEKIYAGKMGEDDIMAARQKMQKLRLEEERKYFPEGFEPAQKFVTLAAEETQTYMMIAYSEDEHL